MRFVFLLPSKFYWAKPKIIRETDYGSVSLCSPWASPFFFSSLPCVFSAPSCWLFAAWFSWLGWLVDFVTSIKAACFPVIFLVLPPVIKMFKSILIKMQYLLNLSPSLVVADSCSWLQQAEQLWKTKKSIQNCSFFQKPELQWIKYNQNYRENSVFILNFRYKKQQKVDIQSIISSLNGDITRRCCCGRAITFTIIRSEYSWTQRV